MRLISLEVLKERYAEHAVLAEEFIQRTNSEYNSDLKLNKNSLFLALKAAYDDIERYKHYHLNPPEEKRSNSVKRSAFICKWVNKIRPIEGNMSDEDLGEIYGAIANAHFSLELATAHISSEVGGLYYYDDEKFYEILYDLTYRELNGDALLYIFQNFFDLASGIPVVLEG